MIESPRALIEAHHMRDFLDSPVYHILMRHLDEAMTDVFTRMTGPDPEPVPANLAHYRGVYEGLKRSRLLPEQIISEGDRVRGGR